jgi:hypothetical protein
MSSYLDQPTVEARLAAYMESEDLELDRRIRHLSDRQLGTRRRNTHFNYDIR